LVLLLSLGVTMLGESVGRREILAISAILVGIAGLGWAAPLREGDLADARLAAALVVLGALSAAPYLGRTRRPNLMIVGAGCAFAWAGVSAKLIADRVTAGDWPAALGWLVATALVAVVGLLSEMSALQRRPATQVAPAVFVVQVALPVALAGAFGREDWGSTPLGGAALAAVLLLLIGGAVVLSRSSAVVGVVDAGPHQLGDRDRAEPPPPQL
jgi:drug/metabolite transporter (DMT)-like permease